MRSTSRVGAFWVIAFGLMGIAWIGLEVLTAAQGLTDGDNPAVALAFLRGHPNIYLPAGIALLMMSISLTVAVHTVSDAAAPRFGSLATRSLSTIGLFAAAFFMMNGVLRLSTGPLLYIDGLNHSWGETAYLIVQMMAVQGFTQGGIFALSAWAAAISLLGLRTGAIPLWLGLLGAIPALRLLAIPGVLDVLPDAFWFVFVLAIPGVMLWSILLGIVLLRRAASH